MMITPDTARALLEKIKALRILVIGDVMLDHYIWGDATRISPEAPVPVVDIARDSYTAGGAANVALNIASLGAHCTVSGYFGPDEPGERLLRVLAEKKISTISTPGSAPTIVKTRVLVQHQQLCRLDREAAPSSYRVADDAIDDLFADPVKSHDAVIFSDYAKGILSADLVAKVSAMARASGRFTALDPKPKRPLKFAHLDLITPNRREALMLAGVTPEPHTPFPAQEVCARLHELYHTRNLVITMSEDGMLLSQNGRAGKTIPTAAREVFDVSGAGDTALATLVLALVAGADLETAAHFANAASGVVVGKIGTAAVTPDELVNYLDC